MSVALDMLELLLRWLHIITGVAWIGASFYFVWLDNNLRAPPQWKADKGVMGDLWAFHGGGIYEVAKYSGAPPEMPERLHWFYWEAYSTWITGALLMMSVYYFQADAYLVKPDGPVTSPLLAILTSLGFVAGAVAVYELLLRSGIFARTVLMAIVSALILLAACWLADWLFAGRAAYIHLGIALGSIMVANVFIGIIPPQRALVRAIDEGRSPDTEALLRAKQRSTHNNYMTLPVLFCMISNHYPVLYGHQHAWLILAFILLVTACSRHFFNLRHKDVIKPQILVVCFALFCLLVVYLVVDARNKAAAVAKIEVSEERALALVETHCTNCHAVQPTQVGFTAPPAGLVLEKRGDLILHAAKSANAVSTGYMPLGNMTNLGEEDRQILAAWLTTISQNGVSLKE